ncbi:hypothetical protein A2230_00290 [candidate division WOR-1 bacterium RIFOXYA2_FULL_36_21]|uniref:Polysaccharide chain length determinant N-terminal domain-containing protein n=1 Tax=candidate division WOR-1 bacterium RIFOXYB2_FULL_36_35 TaxID=1802578 RepID=A0A1F4S598_UNCSA|nr:MAG: hypothetical protein A2230_00290 [candidate division WOR-1 bacterium RIFOXYA2_FULL_36_21]OGC15608.1 MAG: hypothetical protein A2290_05990 [candidate division WOR-1 bacterium RIFOXYB2_FULL_36_35]OGC16842.1 MAG: hypothetical protein A2282_08240 [candidate division WOR-1 bacterium RIFOXYA12_FULL_36_13]
MVKEELFAEGEISLSDIIRILNKYKFFILLVFVVAVTFIHFSAVRQPKMYKATATILTLGSKETSTGGFSNLFSGTPFGFGGGQGTALKSLLTSRVLAESVAKELDLLKALKKGQWDDKKHGWVGGVTPSLESVALDLIGMLNISQDGVVLNITVTGNDPILVTKIANAYVDKLGDFLAQRSLDISFQKLDSALSPNGPFNSDVKKSVMTAGIISFFGAVFLSFIIEYLVEFKTNIKNNNRKEVFK